MDIVQNITKSLNGYIFNMSEKISAEYNVPIEGVLKIWCEQQNVSFDTVFAPMMKISKKTKKIASPSSPVPTLVEISEDGPEGIDGVDEDDDQKEVVTPTTPVATTSKSPSEKVCEYIFSRGPKKGTRCVIMAKTGPLCSKHKLK